MRRLLLPFSWIYGFFVVLRNKLFDLKVLRSESFDVPVVTVGNLSVGGTGKSPLVLHLAQQLSMEYRIAILSRGYGRKTRGFLLLDNQATAVTAGDEPLQYFRMLKNVKVAVCEQRTTGIRELLQRFPDLQLIILDDAYQHRYVKPLMSILLTTYQQPYFRDMLLPAGSLREPSSGAKRADLIVVTKCPETISGEQIKQLEKGIRPGLQQRLFFSYIRYRDLRNRVTDEVVSFDVLKGATVLLVCGIARPEPLFDFLVSCGAKVETLFFPDHHVFTSGDALAMVRKYEKQTASLMITTRKDAMRMESAELQHHLDRMAVYVLDIAPAFIGEHGDPLERVKELLTAH